VDAVQGEARRRRGGPLHLDDRQARRARDGGGRGAEGRHRRAEKGATDALKGKVGIIKTSTASGATKAGEARTAITGADPAILERLEAGDQVALLTALQGEPMPESDEANKDEPQRVAMRKLYEAISLDKKFVEEDDKARRKMIDELVKKKAEIKDAKENWTALTDQQKGEILKVALKAQCAAFGFPEPANPMVIADFSTIGQNEDDNGHYSDDDDVIRINTAQPVFHDFELAMDLIFHENSHNYQGKLVKRLNLPRRHSSLAPLRSGGSHGVANSSISICAARGPAIQACSSQGCFS
jgi:hypothetical protein